MTATRHDLHVDAPTAEAMPGDVTFVVRAARQPDGDLAGVVERVRSDEKQRFDDAVAIGHLIERMLEEESPGNQARRVDSSHPSKEGRHGDLWCGTDTR